MQVDEYESGEVLLFAEKTGKSNHELIFIDYEFEEKSKNGIAIIRELREFKKNVKVIFVSCYAQVVFQSFEVEAFRFLVKPLEEDKLFKALDDYIKLNTCDPILSIRMNGENFFYHERIISYIEGSGKNCIIHFSDHRNEVVCNETLASVGDRLSKESFFRCHKSFLVNQEHVVSYNHTSISMDSGEVILISRNKFREFSEAFTEYILKRRGV